MREKYHIKENKNKFFFPDEWIKVMDLAKVKQAESFTHLINTGARYNEARHIKVSDVDFERNNIVLRITKVKAKKGEKKPTPRFIPVSSQYTKFLKKQIRKYKLDQDDVFPMLKNPAANIALKKLTKELKMKDYMDYSIHNIRKTFECWLIALGNDGFKVAKHLGHTAQVAMNNYISSDIFTWNDKDKIRQLLGDLYSYNDRRY